MNHYSIQWWPYDPEHKRQLEDDWCELGPDGMPAVDLDELYAMRAADEERAPWEDNLDNLALDDCEALAKAVQKRIERLRPSPADKFQGWSLSGKSLLQLVAEGKLDLSKPVKHYVGASFSGVGVHCPCGGDYFDWKGEEWVCRACGASFDDESLASGSEGA